MSRLVQVKDVPDEVHATLKARAALAGVSLSEYLRRMLSRAASRSTPAELAARLSGHGSAELPEPSEVTVRRIRERGE